MSETHGFVQFYAWSYEHRPPDLERPIWIVRSLVFAVNAISRRKYLGSGVWGGSGYPGSCIQVVGGADFSVHGTPEEVMKKLDLECKCAP